MFKHLTLFAIAILLAAAPSVSGAVYAFEQITIRGIVRDADGPVQGASVNLAAAGRVRKPETTDVNGFFALEIVDGTKPSEAVRLQVQKNGYRLYDQVIAATETVVYTITIVKDRPLNGPQSSIRPPTGSENGKQEAPRTSPIPAPIVHFISQLQSADRSDRENAVRALGKMGSDAIPAVPMLAATLLRDEAGIKVTVANAFRDIKPSSQDAVVSLIIALSDTRSADLRTSAAEAVGVLRVIGQPAVPAVLTVLRSASVSDKPAIGHLFLELDPKGKQLLMGEYVNVLETAAKQPRVEFRNPIYINLSKELLQLEPDAKINVRELFRAQLSALRTNPPGYDDADEVIKFLTAVLQIVPEETDEVLRTAIALAIDFNPSPYSPAWTIEGRWRAVQRMRSFVVSPETSDRAAAVLKQIIRED